MIGASSGDEVLIRLVLMCQGKVCWDVEFWELGECRFSKKYQTILCISFFLHSHVFSRLSTTLWWVLNVEVLRCCWTSGRWDLVVGVSGVPDAGRPCVPCHRCWVCRLGTDLLSLHFNVYTLYSSQTHLPSRASHSSPISVMRDLWDGDQWPPLPLGWISWD